MGSKNTKRSPGAYILIPADNEDGSIPKAEVIDGTEISGYEQYNTAIGAEWGGVVRLDDVLEAVPEWFRKQEGIHSLDMWCDDEGLFKEPIRFNTVASVISGQHIVGNVLVMIADSEGFSHGLPTECAIHVLSLCKRIPVDENARVLASRIVEKHKQWMEETNGTGIKVTMIEEGGAA